MSGSRHRRGRRTLRNSATFSQARSPVRLREGRTRPQPGHHPAGRGTRGGRGHQSMRSFTWPSWSFHKVRSVRVEGPDETWLPGGYGRLGGPVNTPEKDRAGTQRRGERRADAGAAGNARLTAANAAVLLVLLAAEGFTVLRVRQLLSPHVFIGVVLIPPVLVKVASTTWRFARYYTGVPAYRRKGPPPVLLRLLGPVVVILTLVLLFSGVGLLLVSRPWLPLLLKVHKASFVLWSCAMSVHVLAHLGEVFRLAPRDWLRRTPREG